MKKIVVVMFLVLCSTAIYGQKIRYGQALAKADPGVDYPIKLHVSGMHIGSNCVPSGGEAYCEHAAYVNVIVRGKKLELMGKWFSSDKHQFRFLPGDYVARLLTPDTKVDDFPINEKYEILLADRTVWRCIVTGFSE
jgi:hypothetical protein